MVQSEHKQNNSDRLHHASRRLSELIDQAEKRQLCGWVTIALPILRGKVGKVKVILEDTQPE